MIQNGQLSASNGFDLFHNFISGIFYKVHFIQCLWLNLPFWFDSCFDNADRNCKSEYVDDNCQIDAQLINFVITWGTVSEIRSFNGYYKIIYTQPYQYYHATF